MLFELKAAIEANDVLKVALIAGSMTGEELDAAKVPPLGDAPLDYAVRKNLPQIAEMLINCGASPNTRISSVFPILYYSTLENQTEMAKLLIAKGAYINEVSLRNQTALYAAVGRDNIVIFEELLKHGADINLLSDDGPPLHEATFNDNEEMVQLLLSHSADVSVRGQYGRTALHVAFMHTSGDNGVIPSLLDAGADINDKDHFGLTSFLLAVQAGEAVLIQKSIESGANINAVSDAGETALHLAVQNSGVEVLQMLLDAGLDINAVTENGDTPTHVATRLGNLEAVQFFKAMGANISLKNNEGHTPLETIQQ